MLYCGLVYCCCVGAEPLIRPVAGSMDMPVGSVPAKREYLAGGVAYLTMAAELATSAAGAEACRLTVAGAVADSTPMTCRVKTADVAVAPVASVTAREMG